MTWQLTDDITRFHLKSNHLLHELQFQSKKEVFVISECAYKHTISGSITDPCGRPIVVLQYISENLHDRCLY